jgi:hypothetical protein
MAIRMNSPENNLFLCLHKWASRQDENFLTEVFAYLLGYLIDNEPTAAVGLLDLLTKGFFKLRPEEVRTVEVRTQVVYAEGRPDLMIRTARQFAYVEVKSESEATSGQIRLYRQLLCDSGVADTRLVLLTRYPVLLEADCPDVFVRWYQVAGWIESLSSRNKFKAVSEFLVQQFLDFLRGRNMAIEHVGWELTRGVRALTYLRDMLIEAASACKVTIARNNGWYFAGILLDGGKYEVSVWFAEPDKLWFGTRCPIDATRAAAMNYGELEEMNGGTCKWWRSLLLDSEDVHFFSRSKASQMQCLEEFVRDSLNKARSITTSDQPLPEEPDEE